MHYIKQHKKIIISGTLVLFVFCSAALAEHNCAKGFDTDGYTLPSGDINLEYGTPLNITCILKESVAEKFGPEASSRLKFVKNSFPVNFDYIKVLNSKSIQLTINEPEKVEKDSYACEFDDGGKRDQTLCINAVSVGVAPQEVTDFKCIGYNYDNITCTWTGPRNYVDTNYTLSYTLNLRSARFSHECPNITSVKDYTTHTTKYSCFWALSTKPQYRQSHDKFTFHLGRKNLFGAGDQSFNFEHYKKVKPNPPEKLTAVGISPHALKLSWVVPSAMVPFPPGVHHRILYTSNFEKSWHLGALIKNVTNPHTSGGLVEFNLTDLRFAHGLYDIRVSLRSSVADDEDMWSNNATVTAYTLPKIPDRPPRTNIGSFELINDSDMGKEAIIYWQQIRKEEMNGQNFSYHVEVENNATMVPCELTKTYAKFKFSSADRPYKFHIWSKNELGHSEDESVVYIPDSESRVKEPSNFVKVVDSKNSDTSDLYELGWQPPRIQEITNYTIFWCDDIHDRPYQCNGNVSWVVVGNNLTSYNLTLPKLETGVYQFAISTNTLGGSSGMLWAQCTIISGKRTGKLNDVFVTKIGSKFIEVAWKLDCRDNIGIVGFVIEYCVISNITEGACVGEPKQELIHESDATRGTLTDLKPYTTYGIQVGVKFKHYDSQMSDMIRNTTYEDAPSAPQNVHVVRITNSSISIQWDPPLVTNGILKYYKVYYSDQKPPLEIERPKTEANITNLEAYTNYSISVEACTIYCTKSPQVLNVKTKMWEPAKVNQPHEIYRNSSYVTIVWDKPSPARGKVDYYQVNFIQEQTTENKTTRPYIIVKEPRFAVQNCGESGKYNTFYVSVRAVNEDGNRSVMTGPWSDTLHSYCRSEYTSWLYIFIAVSIIGTCILLSYLFKKLYHHFSNMQKLVPTLPDGLASVVNEYDIPKTPADETTQTQLLLQRFPSSKSHNSNSDGDSSGCSSGHESRTSSLQSGSRISTSDSGTEQPRTPSMGEADLGLRQRTNVSTKPVVVNKSGYIKPDAIPQTLASKPKATPPGSYCVFGIDPKIESEVESPYIPLTDVAAAYDSEDAPETTPYIVTSEIMKPANPGYVAHTVPEPVSKSTGYVVAGIPTKHILVPDILQEENMGYVKAATAGAVAANSDAFTNVVQFQWQPQPMIETPTVVAAPKTGYVCVGDALPTKTDLDLHASSTPGKGYVSHKQFEAKTLKKD